jgi:cell wall-associated NlpC family hydrolase
MSSSFGRTASGLALLLSIALAAEGSIQSEVVATVEMPVAEAGSLPPRVESPVLVVAPDREPVPHVVAAPLPGPTSTPAPACIGRKSPYRTAYPASVCTLDQAAIWVQGVWKHNGWGTISTAVAKQIIAGKVPARPASSGAVAPKTKVSTSLPAGITPAAREVLQAALDHLGARYVFGSTGPTTFDCSGLVWHAFRTTGHFDVIGNGAYRGGRAIYGYFLSRGLASRTAGRPGDIVVYDGGMHVGLYLGNGRVISALTRGVTIHGLYALTVPFTAFLHTGLDG